MKEHGLGYLNFSFHVFYVTLSEVTFFDPQLSHLNSCLTGFCRLHEMYTDGLVCV